MDQVKPIRLYLLILYLVALLAYTSALRHRPAERSEPPDLERIPRTVADYTSSEELQPEEALRLLGADATVYRKYRNGERTIRLFIGYFGAQQENSQIHSPKHCYPGAGWNIAREGMVPLRFDGGEIAAKHLVISNGEEAREVIYWFDTPAGAITNEFALKWYQMKSALLRRSQKTAFIRFSAEVSPASPQGSHESLKRFIEEIAPAVTASLWPVPELRRG